LSAERPLPALRICLDPETWTTSVCTGSLLLAGAGLLAETPAATHWRARDTLASRPTAVRPAPAPF